MTDWTGTYSVRQFAGAGDGSTVSDAAVSYLGGQTFKLAVEGESSARGPGVVVRYRLSPVPADVFLCDGRNLEASSSRFIQVPTTSQPTGTIFMPAYASSAFCAWNFTVPQGQAVLFTVKRFHTERGYDVLRFVRSVLGGGIYKQIELSGDAEQRNVTAGIEPFLNTQHLVRGAYFTAIFTADTVFEYTGFELTYELIQDPDALPAAQYAPMHFCTYGTPDVTINAARGEVGYLFLPNFVNPIRCRFTILTAATDQTTTLIKEFNRYNGYANYSTLVMFIIYNT